MKKIIVFDIDGTLTRTELLHNRCYFDSLKDCFGIILSEDFDWSTIKNITDGGVLEELYVHFKKRRPTRDEINWMMTVFNEKFEKQVDKNNSIEVDGAKNFVNSLKKDFSVGIATGSWEVPAILKLNSIGLEHLDFPFSNGNHHHTREAILTNVFHQIDENYQKEHVYYFGDGIWDFKTCKNLGINFVGIDHDENGRLKELGTEYVFKDFSNPDQILELIK